MRLLIDGDEANNNGNWQWIASVGTDPAAGVPAHLQPGAPAWSATTRTARYVRRYVPELRDVPGRVPRRAVDDARGGAARVPAA